MADVQVIPNYCSNCKHNQVCKILVNIQSMESQVTKFNNDYKSSLQSVSSINYNCRFKLAI